MTARACKYSSLAVALCASVLALQGCGSTGSGKAAVVKGKVSSKVAEVAGAGFPVSVGTPFGPVTLQRRPERVVSLSPTATEMLFAIGAGRQVVAVDNDSDYPPNAPRTKLSGYTPNVEAIAGYKPDLVVISYNPTPPNLVASLKVLHIPALYLPAAADLSQTYAELTELGKLTGQVQGAKKQVAWARSQVASLVAQVPHFSSPPTYFYEVGYDPLYTATSSTFVGSVLSLAGLRNIAGASVDGSDYPEYSSEPVLRANPTFVFLADGASLASVAARPGWSVLSSVRDGRVIALNADIASRWGPRIVELLRSVVDAERQYARSVRKAAA